MNYKMIAVVFLIALMVLFGLQNVAVVEIQFLLWSARMPRSLLIFLMLGIGMLIGWFLRSFVQMRKR